MAAINTALPICPTIATSVIDSSGVVILVIIAGTERLNMLLISRLSISADYLIARVS